MYHESVASCDDHIFISRFTCGLKTGECPSPSENSVSFSFYSDDSKEPLVILFTFVGLHLSSLGAGIAQWCCLDDRGVRVPEGVGSFSLHHHVQTGSGAHSASYPMGTRALSLGIQRPGREADHTPTSSAEVKNAWSYTSTPPISLHDVVLS
jgi:hypothetical protein